MAAITDDIIREITERLVREALPAKIVLFGSCAHRKPGRDVEKALIAWPTIKDVEFPKTHDLEVLDDLLSDNAAQLPTAFESLLDLSAIGVRFRYQPYCAFEEALDRPERATRAESLILFVETQLR